MHRHIWHQKNETKKKDPGIFWPKLDPHPWQIVDFFIEPGCCAYDTTHLNDAQWNPG